MFLKQALSVLILLVLFGSIAKAEQIEIKSNLNDTPIDLPQSTTLDNNYGGGYGTATDPYIISKLEHLCILQNDSNNWDKYFLQIADIDATDTKKWNVGDHDLDSDTPDQPMGFSPIGSGRNRKYHNIPFTGSYNGQNFTINNLSIDRSIEPVVGLFGFISKNGSISNLSLVDANIIGQVFVGGLVGCSDLSSTISNCSVTGSVIGSGSFVGGLIGESSGAVINSYSISSVSSYGNNIGGLVGASYSIIKNCYSKSSVSSSGKSIGVLVGSSDSIINCYSTGTIKGDRLVGGLSGTSNFISNCYSVASVSGNVAIGGLAGASNFIHNSYSTGSVNGTGDYVGGLVGFYDDSPTIANSYWDIETSGQSTSGGGIGLNTIHMGSEILYEKWNIQEDNTLAKGGPPKLILDSNRDLIWKINYSNNIFEGEGTEDNPFKISTLSDLQKLSVLTSAWDFHFIQTADIDATDTKKWNIGDHDLDSDTPDQPMGFSPIGYLKDSREQQPFRGSYNGQCFTISNLTIDRPGYYRIGLFRSTSDDSSISNVFLVEANISGGSSVGSLVGELSSATVNNCSTTGSINGSEDYIGGLFGKSSNSSIINSCYYTGSINGKHNTGGLIGRSTNSTIKNCYSTGLVMGGNFVGGLIGDSSESSITNCYSTNSVSGDGTVGGLIGQSSSYNTPISNCYSTGSVSSTGLLNSYIAVGGLVGISNSIINNCYSTSSVKGTKNQYACIVGGLVGFNNSTISNCYSACPISDIDFTASGGLVGASSDQIMIKNSYWDIEVSGKSISSGGTGKNSTDMKNKTTFIDWNFEDFWKIDPDKNSGYPYL